MFVGHAAVGFAAKRAAPRASMQWLMTAPYLLDLLWPVFLLLGLEQVRVDPGATPTTPLDFVHYPYTHSLVAAVLWSLLLAGLYDRLQRDRRGAVVIALAALSHWILDVVSHRPDLPLWPGGPLLGFGLWYSRPATMAVEGAMFAAGLAVYGRTTRAKSWTGHASLWSFVAVLVGAYGGALFGPPPPGEFAIAASGLISWLFVPWAGWIERTRELRP